MAEKLYKFLGKYGEPCNGGNGSWHLPRGGHPGRWMPTIEGDLVPCARGYHLCRCADLAYWIGPVLYEAEARGDVVVADNKVVVRQARLLRRIKVWDSRMMRLFACACASRVLPIFERKYPLDKRPRLAIRVARRYAVGKASSEELDAAWAAAGDAAGAAGDAAWDAAWAAARDAAWDAARAAGDAERASQCRWFQIRLPHARD